MEQVRCGEAIGSQFSYKVEGLKHTAGLASQNRLQRCSKQPTATVPLRHEPGDRQPKCAGHNTLPARQCGSLEKLMYT